MRKAILYIRVASVDDCVKPNGQLQKQTEELKQFCKKHRIKVERVYSDIHDGLSFNRNGFKAMLSDLRLGIVKADLLLMKDWHQFSRHPFAAFDMILALRFYKVKVRILNDFDEHGNLISEQYT